MGKILSMGEGVMEERIGERVRGCKGRDNAGVSP